MVPLAQLLSGGTLAGPLFLTQSVLYLTAAIIIKCAAFAILEPRLPWRTAVRFMLLANLFSTIPGVLAAVFGAVFSVFATPFVAFLGNAAGRRLSQLPDSHPVGRRIGKRLALGVTLAFIASVVLFHLAGSSLETRQYASYWIMKVLFACLAVTAGMAISALLEEFAIAKLARKSHGSLSFFTPVIRANYITLGLVLFGAAAQVLPKRLHAPHFILGSRSTPVCSFSWPTDAAPEALHLSTF